MVIMSVAYRLSREGGTISGEVELNTERDVQKNTRDIVRKAV